MLPLQLIMSYMNQLSKTKPINKPQENVRKQEIIMLALDFCSNNTRPAIYDTRPASTIPDLPSTIQGLPSTIQDLPSKIPDLPSTIPDLPSTMALVVTTMMKSHHDSNGLIYESKTSMVRFVLNSYSIPTCYSKCIHHNIVSFPPPPLPLIGLDSFFSHLFKSILHLRLNFLKPLLERDVSESEVKYSRVNIQEGVNTARVGRL